MNLDEIKRILQLMEENKLVEFEYEDEGRRVKLRRADDRVPAPLPIAVQAAMPMMAAAAPATAEVPAGAAARPANVMEFKSPLVGTFYRSAKPDADPFANPGDEIGPEKVICIIEAMKVMNEIKAEMSGVIREILVKNGQAVEFGEPLFLIEKK
jgi:acetyl-CoA carboxylase biotin carboxyl carrier protein